MQTKTKSRLAFWLAAIGFGLALAAGLYLIFKPSPARADQIVTRWVGTTKVITIVPTKPEEKAATWIGQDGCRYVKIDGLVHQLSCPPTIRLEIQKGD